MFGYNHRGTLGSERQDPRPSFPFCPFPSFRKLAAPWFRTGEFFAPQINTFARMLPKNRMTAEIMRHTGMIMPSAKPEDIVP